MIDQPDSSGGAQPADRPVDISAGSVPLGPPTSSARARKPLPWIIGTIAAVVMLCCGIGAVANLVGEPGEPSAGSVNPTVNASPSPSPSIAVTSAIPTTTPPAPPTTSAPAPTSAAPKPKPKPRVYTGRGDDVVKVGELTDLLIVKFSCPRCTSNTVLTSDGPETLMVNEIGAYTGKMWINLEDSALTTQFEVEASGKWTLTIGTIEQMATKATSGKATGRGDDVIVLGGDADTARITHSKGQSNFVVYAYSLETGEGGLLVNEIGGYAGTRPLQAPALVQVTADGTWSISPQ